MSNNMGSNTGGGETTKNYAVAISLSCIVSIITSFAAFSYNQGTNDQKLETAISRVAKVEQAMVDVSELSGNINLLRQEVGFMREGFNEIKGQNERWASDMNTVQLYIAEQKGAARAQNNIINGGG